MVQIPNAVFSTSPRLMDFFAENPGDWANAIGLKITNVDVGTKQLSSLTLSGTWNAGTSVNLNFSYDGQVKNIVQAFQIDYDTSLQLLANQLTEWLSTFGFPIVSIETPLYSNQKFISITAPISGTDLELDGWSVAGADQIVVTHLVNVAGVESTRRFTVNVYSSASVNVPIDIYKCSFNRETDENGISMFVEDVINLRSKYIRVFLNGDPETMQLDGDDTEITWLAGGDDGVLPTSADVIAGWEVFSNPETSTIRLAISGGYSTPDVAKQIISICEKRKDCFAILETPLSSQTADEVVDYRQRQLGVDTNRAALYAPGVWLTDTQSGSKIMCPISGVIASNYIAVDKNYGDQYAPAGYNRSVITAGEPTAYYLEPDRDILGPAQVNYVGRHNLNLPWSIMDEKTLTNKQSWLSWVHVRRTITRMQINITDALYYKLWDFSDQTSLDDIQTTVQAYGNQMIIDRRCQNFKASAYTTPEDEVLGLIYVDALIRPTGVIREVKFTTIITNDVAQFDESSI